MMWHLCPVLKAEVDCANAKLCMMFLCVLAT